MQISGLNGSLTLQGRSILLERRGVVAVMSQGFQSKVVPLSSLGGIELKRPVLGGRGRVHLRVAGELPDPKARPENDPNSVIFKKADWPQVEAWVSAVNEALAA